ncbi:MAG: universal stress protein, partial [Desulfobacterales bacterium]|nr:universal stress protein [Desulfobacterales bacterium]
MADIGKKKVLAALDGSRASLDTVAYLAHVLPAAGSEVVLFTITTATPESFWDIEGEPSQDLTDLWKKHRKKSLENFVEEARKIFSDKGFDQKDILVKIQERTKGIARDIIRESAKGYDAVLIGRTGMNPIT